MFLKNFIVYNNYQTNEFLNNKINIVIALNHKKQNSYDSFTCTNPSAT